MEIKYQTMKLEEAVENSSFIEDAVEAIQGQFYGISSEFYSGGSRCNCHSKCQSGSHSKSRSSASFYAPQKEKRMFKR